MKHRRWFAWAALLVFSASCATTEVSTDTAPQQSAPGPSSVATSSVTRAVDVTGVQVQMDDRGVTSIVVMADGALADYASFMERTPPRLIIDLPHARNAIAQPIIPQAGSPVSRVQAIQIQRHPVPLLRLMFNLDHLLPYHVEFTRNGMQILVDAEGSAQRTVAQTPTELKQTSESVMGTVGSPSDRTQDGPLARNAESAEGTTRGSEPTAATMVTKPAVTVDQPTSLPQQSRSPVLTTATEKPVANPAYSAETGLMQSTQPSIVLPPTVKEETLPSPIPQKPAVPATTKRPNAEAGVRAGPNTLPSASAIAKQPIAQAPAAPKVPATNKRLSLDFKDADLDEIIWKVIREASGLNIVIAHGLKKREERNVTVRLTNVEWRQALDVILRTKGLSYEQDGNVIYIGSKAEIQKSKEERAREIEQAEHKRLQLEEAEALKTVRIEEAKRKAEEAKLKAEEERRRVEAEKKKAEEEERRYAEEPPCTKVIRFAHTKASEVKRHLERLRTRRGSIELEETTNTLIVNDIESACLKMVAFAKELDTPPKDPFVTKLLPFNYAKASDLKTHLTALKTTQGSVIVDERSSRIIVKDLPDAVERIELLLKQIDIPTPQVLIEARIVEASRTFSQGLGIQWGGTGIPTNSGSTTGVTAFGGSTSGSVRFPTSLTPPTNTPFPTTSGGGVPFVGPIPLALNLPVTSPHFAVGMTIGSLANRFLVGVQLSAAEKEGKIRTLSSPRVATQDNEEAEIKQGTQVPYTTIDSSGRTVVQFQDAFIKLKVKPHITPDGRVSMKVEAERSFPGERVDFSGGFVFPINTRKATTNILVQNGSTVVIGGLFQSSESIIFDQVPALGEIPFLGWLFKRRTVGPDERVELLIFLTPSVLQEARR